MADVRLRTLLGQRVFMRFWFARLAGVMASQMLMVALGWQMYEITGSAWDLGLVGLVQFVPALLLALPAGHLADRVHRGRILNACFAVQVGVGAALWLAAWNDAESRELLLVLSAVLGAVRAFSMPVVQSLTPLLVPHGLLTRAMAFSSSGLQGAIIVGPALGGALFTAGIVEVYGACTVLFLAGLLLAMGVRYHHAPRPREPMSIDSLLVGVRFIFRRKLLLGAMSLDLFAVLLGGAVALLPVYARDVLHVGASGLGILRAAPAVGALAMAVALTRWPPQRRVGVTLLGAVAGFGLATVVFGLSTNFALSLAALAMIGATDMVNVVIRQSLVQLETPDSMRGRVSAVSAIFIGGSNQLGEFESGATAAWFGAVASVVAGGVGTMLIAAAWVRLFPELAKRDRMTELRPQPDPEP